MKLCQKISIILCVGSHAKKSDNVGETKRDTTYQITYPNKTKVLVSVGPQDSHKHHSLGSIPKSKKSNSKKHHSDYILRELQPQAYSRVAEEVSVGGGLLIFLRSYQDIIQDITDVRDCFCGEGKRFSKVLQEKKRFKNRVC